MRYVPEAPPRGATSDQLAEYMLRELQRVAATLDHPEATQIHYGREVDNNATGSTLTIDWRRGQKQRVDMTSDCTFTFNAPEGACNLMLRLVQDGTGGRDPTFPSTVKWQGGTAPTWVTTTNAVNVIAMYFDGTNYHSTASVDSK
jgi:hypothetical protein